MTQVSPTAERRVAPVHQSKIGEVAIETYMGIDETDVPGDVLIATVRRKGKWKERIDTPINTAIRMTVGEYFHDALKRVSDFAELSTALIAGDPADVPMPFKNVMFIDGIGSITSTLSRALEACDDEGFESVVVPLVALADSPSEYGSARALRAFVAEIVLTLESINFRSIKTVKVVHPSGGGDYSAARRRRALAAKAKEASDKASGKPEKPVLYIWSTLVDIAVLEADAVMACIASDQSESKFAISDVLSGHVGTFLDKQLSRWGDRKDGRTFLTSVSKTHTVGFSDVIFIVNDGVKSVSEYVAKALAFADKCGFKVVTVPLTSFIDTPDADDRVLGKLIDEIKAGIVLFHESERCSVEVVYIAVPGLRAANAEKVTEMV